MADSSLCDVYRCTCVAQFACCGIGGVARYGFQDGLGRRLDQVLGLFETQVGQLTDHLDDLDLLGAEVLQHHVKLGLRFGDHGDCGFATTTAGGCRCGDGGCRHAPFFFKPLDQVCQIKDFHVTE